MFERVLQYWDTDGGFIEIGDWWWILWLVIRCSKRIYESDKIDVQFESVEFQLEDAEADKIRQPEHFGDFNDIVNEMQ